jgi:class 3 adenylate cyclase
MSASETLTTVVFVDVEGSTAVIDRLGDAAGTQAVLRQLAVARERLAPHGGREVKSLGDGLLLTFGSPRQAVAFGVSCQRALGTSAPRIRIGINTGEVVNLGGDPVGGTVNAAARIAARAEGGEVLVSDVVRQLAGATPVVRFVERGRVHLRGFGEPWQLWAVVDGTAAMEVPATIGRLPELGVVSELVTALAAGVGRAVVVEGEAGIGKSHVLPVGAGQARAAGLTVIELSVDEVARRPGAVAFALAEDGRVPASHRARLRDLLSRSVSADGVEDLSYAVTEACADSLEVLTRTVPVLVVAEDLHWADDLSLGILRSVVKRSASSALAVLAACRPVPRPAHLDRVLETVRDVGGRLVTLRPLDDVDVQALSAALVGAAAAPGLRARLQATGGNPLFVSELLRSLEEEDQLRIESGVAEIKPGAGSGSLGATLLRRLSWLPEGTRDLLRLASLLGTTFTLSELSALTGSRSWRWRPGCETRRWPVSSWVTATGSASATTSSARRSTTRCCRPSGATSTGRPVRRWPGAGPPSSRWPGSSVTGPPTETWRRSGGWCGLPTTSSPLHRVRPWTCSSGPSARADGLAGSPSGTGTADRAARLVRPVLACRGAGGRRPRHVTRRRAGLRDRARPRRHPRQPGRRRVRDRPSPSRRRLPGAPEGEARRLRCFSGQLEAMLGTLPLPDARDQATEELQRAGDLGDVTGQCVALQVLGTVASLEGRSAEARAHLQRSMALHESGHVRLASYVIPDLFLAATLYSLDELDECLRATDRARRRHLERGALTSSRCPT